ncbi:hypothetical protein AMAG_18189 [Allomyces macrogynus ATCC 38327]|uniref:Uncharacterized protein n=1 Tax=Allomyces macrogynus (strain ATCC 38327) TaxID=578462 RepID=A0A0L0SAJ9_ALLM3|nr:hypothetical protein AMAG_18189 [Allomyces macrogynus ATCC 38327]|eukprot:KNE59496.1 hypothetical protein AMAG_18189 [Allomyces macrogynus ATCC 38327]
MEITQYAHAVDFVALVATSTNSILGYVPADKHDRNRMLSNVGLCAAMASLAAPFHPMGDEPRSSDTAETAATRSEDNDQAAPSSTDHGSKGGGDDELHPDLAALMASATLAPLPPSPVAADTPLSDDVGDDDDDRARITMFRTRRLATVQYASPTGWTLIVGLLAPSIVRRPLHGNAGPGTSVEYRDVSDDALTGLVRALAEATILQLGWRSPPDRPVPKSDEEEVIELDPLFQEQCLALASMVPQTPVALDALAMLGAPEMPVLPLPSIPGSRPTPPADHETVNDALARFVERVPVPDVRGAMLVRTHPHPAKVVATPGLDAALQRRILHAITLRWIEHSAVGTAFHIADSTSAREPAAVLRPASPASTSDDAVPTPPPQPIAANGGTTSPARPGSGLGQAVSSFMAAAAMRIRKASALGGSPSPSATPPPPAPPTNDPPGLPAVAMDHLSAHVSARMAVTLVWFDQRLPAAGPPVMLALVHAGSSAVPDTDSTVRDQIAGPLLDLVRAHAPPPLPTRSAPTLHGAPHAPYSLPSPGVAHWPADEVLGMTVRGMAVVERHVRPPDATARGCHIAVASAQAPGRGAGRYWVARERALGRGIVVSVPPPPASGARDAAGGVSLIMPNLRAFLPANLARDPSLARAASPWPSSTGSPAAGTPATLATTSPTPPPTAIEIRLPTTWAEVDAGIAWLLEDPLLVPTRMANDDPDMPARIILGFDTEVDITRGSHTLTDAWATRNFPSTFQIGAASRALIVPLFDLVARHRAPISLALRRLLAADDRIIWAGVGLTRDLGPLKNLDSAINTMWAAHDRDEDTGEPMEVDGEEEGEPEYGLAPPPDRVVDIDRVVKPWNIPSNLEDLTFQLTSVPMRHADAIAAAATPDAPLPSDLLPTWEWDDGSATQPVAGVEDAALVPAAHGHELTSVPDKSADCMHCGAHATTPHYALSEEAMLGLGSVASGTYPHLGIGWKCLSLSTSPWDRDPRHWSLGMLIYAGLDAVASRAIAVAVQADQIAYTMPRVPFKRYANGPSVLVQLRQIFAYVLHTRGGRKGKPGIPLDVAMRVLTNPTSLVPAKPGKSGDAKEPKRARYWIDADASAPADDALPTLDADQWVAHVAQFVNEYAWLMRELEARVARRDRSPSPARKSPERASTPMPLRTPLLLDDAIWNGTPADGAGELLTPAAAAIENAPTALPTTMKFSVARLASIFSGCAARVDTSRP